MLTSSLSLQLRFTCTKIQTPPPYFFLFDVGPYNLKIEISNFCSKICGLSMFLKKRNNVKVGVNYQIKVFERFKILIHATNI